jgi:hypothetical protein
VIKRPRRLSLASLAVVAVTITAAASAQPAPTFRALTRIICVGEKCDAVNGLGSQVIPTLTAHSKAGELMVEGDDPIASCLTRLERDKAPDVSSCVARRLGGFRQGTTLRENDADVYAVLVLQDVQSHVQGFVTFLTTAGRTVTTDVVLSPLAVLPDGTVEPISLERAGPDSPIILTFHDLPAKAAMAGLQGLPPHRVLIRSASQQGTGEYWGSAILKNTRTP